MEIWLFGLAFVFLSSLIWLIRNWNAHGPTDPLIEIGYWATPRDTSRPDPDAFLDPDWSQEEREQVLHYLDDGLPLPGTGDQSRHVSIAPPCWWFRI